MIFSRFLADVVDYIKSRVCKSIQVQSKDVNLFYIYMEYLSMFFFAYLLCMYAWTYSVKNNMPYYAYLLEEI